MSDSTNPPKTPKAPRRPGRLRRRWQGLSLRTRRLILGGVGGLFLGLFGLVGLVYATTDIPLPEDVVRPQSAVVLYADGSRFGVIEGEENRVDIPLAKVPEHVRKAVLAAEDEGFYGHSGVSLRGITRAAWANLRGARVGQGGSTITQQYVKGAFLTRERTLSRKFKEVVIAVKLDRKYDKDQILEFYLNTVYFGRGAYGIEAAARTFFGVPAERLTLEQGALLATLIRSPEGGDPSRNPELAERRWRAVLDNMVEEEWLEKADADRARFPEQAKAKRLGKQRNKLGGQVGHIFEEIQRELEAEGFDTAKLFQGVTIRTTLTRKAQEAAEKAIPTVLDGEVPKDLRTALVAVEPGSGRIRAMYGGSDYLAKQYNFATQATKRQPGSSFKPYVLAAAIEEGIGLRSRYDGRSPQDIAGEDWENFEGESYGRVDLIEATAKSVNTVYVKLAEDTGIDKVIDTAKAAGIPEEGRHLPRELGLALGSGGVSPLDQANAFATFAAKGKRARPFIVEQVIDKNNKQIYRTKPESVDAIAEDVAADVTYAMTQVVDRGTGQRAELAGRPAAGKTGTTSDNVDAWFVGYTPQLSTAVWMGFDDPKRKLVGIQGRTVTGGTFPAPIFKAFMDGALAGEPVLPFPPPAFAGRDRDAAPPSATATPTPSVTSAVPTVVPTTAAPTFQPTVLPTTEPTAEPTETQSEEPEPTTSPTDGGGGEAGAGESPGTGPAP